MKRKNFLSATLMTIPALAFAKQHTRFTSTKNFFIVRAGNNRSGNAMIKYMGMHPNDVIISRKDTDDELSVFLFTGHGMVGTPLHVHYHQDEFFTVIEGKYKFVCGDTTVELNAGDSIFLPRNIPHQWLQLSANGKLIYAVTPAGKLEDFFKDVDKLKSPTTADIDKMALNYGVKHLGPPLSL